MHHNPNPIILFLDRTFKDYNPIFQNPIPVENLHPLQKIAESYWKVMLLLHLKLLFLTRFLWIIDLEGFISALPRPMDLLVTILEFRSTLSILVASIF